MSRLPIPGSKEDTFNKHYKQSCVYSFPKKYLAWFLRNNKKTPIENHEDIEILRFLENGIPIKMLEVNSKSFAIDTPEDLEMFRKTYGQN